MYDAFDRTVEKSTSLTPSQHIVDKKELGGSLLADTHLNRTKSLNERTGI